MWLLFSERQVLAYLFKILIKFHDKKLSWISEDGNLEVYLNQKDDSNIAARIKCFNQDIFHAYK